MSGCLGLGMGEGWIGYQSTEDGFRSFSEKPITRISYAHEKDLVEKEFQEQFNSTTKEPLSMQDMVDVPFFKNAKSQVLSAWHVDNPVGRSGWNGEWDKLTNI